MRDLTKAQLTVGFLACFTMVWGLVQNALAAPDRVVGFGIAIFQLLAIIILSIIILGILEWIRIFDLKTNSILTLIVLISVRLLSIIN